MQVGRLRSVICYAIGSKKQAYKMETLIVGGITIPDPGLICRLTTVHFTDWFTPQYPKSISIWEQLLTNRAFLYAHAREKASPISTLMSSGRPSAIGHRPPR